MLRSKSPVSIVSAGDMPTLPPLTVMVWMTISHSFWWDQVCATSKKSTEATGEADGSPTLLALMNKTVKAVTGHLTARHHRPKEKFTLSTATREKCQGIRALTRLESKNQKMLVKSAERTRQKLPSSPKKAFLGGGWGRWAILFLKNFAVWNKLLFSGVCSYPGKYNRTPGLT